MEDPLQISRNSKDIVNAILRHSKIKKEIETNPGCMRQVEGHLRIMATEWKFRIKKIIADSKNSLRKSEQVEHRLISQYSTALGMGKHLFLEPGEGSPLSRYLFVKTSESLPTDV